MKLIFYFLILHLIHVDPIVISENSLELPDFHPLSIQWLAGDVTYETVIKLENKTNSDPQDKEQMPTITTEPCLPLNTPYLTE